MKNYIQIGANIGNDDFQKIIENLKEMSTVILIEPNLILLEQLSNNYKHLKDKHNIGFKNSITSRNRIRFYKKDSENFLKWISNDINIQKEYLYKWNLK